MAPRELLRFSQSDRRLLLRLLLVRSDEGRLQVSAWPDREARTWHRREIPPDGERPRRDAERRDDRQRVASVRPRQRPGRLVAAAGVLAAALLERQPLP